MDKLPMEYIDKLFDCMELFYQDRWTKQFDSFYPKDMAKVIWQSALCGCTYDEIKRALVLLKQAARNPCELSPHYMEFYRYAKGTAVPRIQHQRPQVLRGDPAIAKQALDDINSKLRYRDKRQA